jgi:hypothetical protein
MVKKIKRYIVELVGRRLLIRLGLEPKGTHVYSKNQNHFIDQEKLRLPVDNLVGYFHHIMRQYWDHYGLGDKCLLVSENVRVKKTLREKYPAVEFITTDLFTDLYQSQDDASPDVIWDVCTEPPAELKNNTFNSVICQSLLEHVIAPTTAIINMFKLLGSNGYIYLLTHTPSFPLHRYPKDYVRFHHDYFEDLPVFIQKTCGIKIVLSEMYSSKGVIVLCYQKME